MPVLTPPLSPARNLSQGSGTTYDESRTLLTNLDEAAGDEGEDCDNDGSGRSGGSALLDEYQRDFFAARRTECRHESERVKARRVKGGPRCFLPFCISVLLLCVAPPPLWKRVCCVSTARWRTHCCVSHRCSTCTLRRAPLARSCSRRAAQSARARLAAYAVPQHFIQQSNCPGCLADGALGCAGNAPLLPLFTPEPSCALTLSNAIPDSSVSADIAHGHDHQSTPDLTQSAFALDPVSGSIRSGSLHMEAHRAAAMAAAAWAGGAGGAAPGGAEGRSGAAAAAAAPSVAVIGARCCIPLPFFSAHRACPVAQIVPHRLRLSPRRGCGPLYSPDTIPSHPTLSGAGACALPLAFLSHLPRRATIAAVDFDAEVLEIARAHFLSPSSSSKGGSTTVNASSSPTTPTAPAPLTVEEFWRRNSGGASSAAAVGSGGDASAEGRLALVHGCGAEFLSRAGEGSLDVVVVDCAAGAGESGRGAAAGLQVRLLADAVVVARPRNRLPTTHPNGTTQSAPCRRRPRRPWRPGLSSEASPAPSPLAA